MSAAMSTRQSTLSLTAILFAALLAAPGWGQAGVIRGTVVDGDMQPIPGVEITVTSSELPDFRETLTSNERGLFRLRFTKNQVQYRFDLLFEKAGYESFTQPVSPSAIEQISERFVMERSSAEVAERRGDLSSVVTGSTNQAIALFNAGLTAQREGDLASARARFEEALAADPELGPAHVGLAQVQLDQRQHEAALTSADRALALGAGRVQALRVKYEALRELGRREEAEAVAVELETADTAVASALRLYNEGGQAFQAGDREGALAKFLSAAELDPTLIEAHHAIATIELAKGNLEASAAAAEKALALGSEDLRTLRVLYEAYDALGRTEELAEIVPRLAAVDPDFGGAKLVEQAAEAWNAGDTARAVSLSRLALRTDPKLAKAYYFIGLDHLSRSENDEARQALATFLQLAPDDEEAATAKEMLSYLE